MKNFRKVVAGMTAAFVLSTSIIPAPITTSAEATSEIVEDVSSIAIHYQAPEKVDRLKDFTIELEAEGADRVKLVYKQSEQSAPVTLDMESSVDKFKAVIPKTALWSSAVTYWFEVEGSNQQHTSESYVVPVEGGQSSNKVNPLYMTEMQLFDKNYAFIEVYNNTDQSLDLKNYDLTIGNEKIDTTEMEQSEVDSGETKIIWLQQNDILTINDFKVHYDVNIASNQIATVKADKFPTNHMKVSLQANDNKDELSVSAIYQSSDGVSGQLYYYMENGNEMRHGGDSAYSTPGKVMAEQVPATLYPLPEVPEDTEEAQTKEENKEEVVEDKQIEKKSKQDEKAKEKEAKQQTASIKHEAITTIDPAKDTVFEVEAADAKEVTLHYQTGKQMAEETIAFEKGEQAHTYQVEIPKDKLWSPHFFYTISVEKEDGETIVYPETGKIEAEVKQTETVDYQSVPRLLITELVPDTVNANKLDAYEFIEVYNNGDQPINMEDYQIIYRYPSNKSDQHWQFTDDKEVAPGESFIVWIHNAGNKDKTIADFNAQYNLSLTEDDVTIVESEGMANGAERTVIIADKYNNEISEATYNENGKEVKADKGIIYQYPEAGNKMRKVGHSETVTPTEVIPGQVPAELVKVEVGGKVPTITHEQPTVESGEDITFEVEVSVEDTSKPIDVVAYAKQLESFQYETIRLKKTDQENIYQMTIPANKIWNDQITYYFEANTGGAVGKTETFTLPIPQPEVDFQKLPPLLITELVPDSTNVGGADGYEFIEVYNNSNETVNFSDYTIRYRYPMEGAGADAFWDPEVDEDILIPSGETAIFWVINNKNGDKTAADFNANYGSQLMEGENLFRIHSAGMANSSHRALVIATKSGIDISSAHYFDEVNVDDTKPDKGIFYRYPTDGSIQSQKISGGQLPATPGEVMVEKVPKEKVTMVADTEKPVIKNLTEQTTVEKFTPLKLIAQITDNIMVKKVNLHYRTTVDAAFESINLTIGSNNEYSHIIYEPELIGKEFVEYYFTASDGTNITKSETYKVDVEGAAQLDGLRLNVDDDEWVAGDKILKATGEEGPSDLSLAIDKEEVTDTFRALETEAYFAFDVRKTNIFFQNGVTMGDEIMHIFDDTINTYTTLTVPIPEDKLKIGKNTISIRSGNKVSPFDEESTENRNDFTVKNVRLVLSDGTTIYDPNYDNVNKELLLGDDGSSIPFIDFEFNIEEEKFTSLAYKLDSTRITDGDHTVTASSSDESIEKNIQVDNTAPEIVTNIDENNPYKGKFTLDADITDNLSGVAETTVTLDGKHITLPYETSSGMLTPGKHTLHITSVDEVGNEAEKEIKLETVEEHPFLPDFLEKEPKDTSAELSVRVSDPTNDDLDVSFYESYKYSAADDNVKVSAYASETEPPQSYKPDGEIELTEEEIAKIEKFDGESVELESVTKFPYHRFDVEVDEKVTADDEIEVVWNGSSLPGRKVTMYAWNYEQEDWIALTSTVAGEDAFTLVGSIQDAAFIKDQKISVIVQDQIEGIDRTDFTFIWMTDTQYYSKSYPHIYKSQVDWIVEKQEELNIQYVFHTGDLVDNWDSEKQWKVADESMKVLDDANVPYGVLAGNHDVDHKSNDYEEYYKYFGEDRFKDKPYYGESYMDNRGHYDLISANGNDFIMLYMGWGVDQGGIDWMNDILAQYPDRKAFINFHEYLLASGTRSPIGDEIFEKVVIPNENVLAVLAGHYHNSQKLVDEIDDDGDGVPDRTVYQMLADYQGGPEGGQGFMRILSFDTEKNELDVKTYSPYLDQYNYYDPEVNPGKDEFTLDWDTTPQVKKVATDYVSINVYTNNLIDKVENVPSGEEASVIWDKLNPNGKYAWHVIAEDNYDGKTRSPIWTFKTEKGKVIEPEPEPEPNPDLKPDPEPNPNPDSEQKPGPEQKPGTEGQPDDEHKPSIDNSGITENPEVGLATNNGNTLSNSGNLEIENTSDNDRTDQTDKLPRTATMIYQYLVLGMLLMIAGFSLVIYSRRKQSMY